MSLWEHRMIPELKSTEAWIRKRLDEVERGNFMQLGHFKQMPKARQELAAGLA